MSIVLASLKQQVYLKIRHKSPFISDAISNVVLKMESKQAGRDARQVRPVHMI